MLFERDDQPVCGGARERGGRLQLGEVERPGAQRLEDDRRLVDHADAAYTDHIQERYPT
jgi:hypothetical protein